MNKNIKFKILFNRLLVLLLISITIFSLYSTYKQITFIAKDSSPDPNKVINWILIDLILILSSIVVAARKYFKFWSKHNSPSIGYKLQNRIIQTFSLIAIIPTIIVAIFSVYFFNYGIQSWFNKRINTVLEQSINIAESYIDEHKIALKDTASAIAGDLNEFFYESIYNPEIFQNIVDTQADIRSLDEIMVFNATTNHIIAHSAFSFSLIFETIPAVLVEKASQGEVVEVPSDPGKIRMLSKINDHNNTYLIIGRLVDEKIIDYVDKTNGAAQEYVTLKSRIANLQIKFSITFIILAFIIVLTAIFIGIIFATNFLKPIRSLLLATSKVKNGDLTVRVEEGPKNDEIAILSTAFNIMIRQLERQQKDLIIAQRASAWADVAKRVAHEIKNPLTPIQLACELLMRKFNDQIEDRETFNRYGNTILRHVEEIRRIVAEFVDFAKLPSPKFEIFDIVNFIEDYTKSLKDLKKDYIYVFEKNTDFVDFKGDKLQLGQVLNNLIKNAEESLEICDSSKIIKVCLHDSQNILVIDIIDNGKGFPSDLIDRITEPYLTTRTKGTGLGLAIVKKIVEDHNGRLEISNIINQQNLALEGALVKLTFIK